MDPMTLLRVIYFTGVALAAITTIITGTYFYVVETSTHSTKWHHVDIAGCTFCGTMFLSWAWPITVFVGPGVWLAKRRIAKSKAAK